MTRRVPRRVEVSISALTDEGLGAGVFENRALRVRNALPGETADCTVRKRRKGVWYAVADTPAGAAADRVPAPCEAYPRCGGCVLQHLRYDRQLEHKEAVLRRLLAAHDISTKRVHAPVAGPRFHYRRRARLGARVVDGTPLLGFSEAFSSRVTRMSACATLAPPLARALPELQALLGELSDPTAIPQLELVCGDADAAFLVRHLRPFGGTDLAALARFAASPGRRVYLQSAGYESLRGIGADDRVLPLGYGNPDFGLWFEYLPTDFTQVNAWINRALVRAAVLALDPRPGDRVADLFCGIGNFSLALAGLGARVYGYESAPGAIERAQHNAALNRLSGRAEFSVADLYDAACPALPPVDLLLLDPPRSGAGPNLRRWAGEAALRRIVYVSCNPETFAADAAVLGECGFELDELGVFDMFPHTAHVETLGLFVRSR